MADNFFGITDRGRIRDNNEDTFIAEKINSGKLVVACVIDGVGGYEGGEIAARIAKECITEYLHSAGGDIVGTMKNALVSSNERIYKENQQRNQQEPMACVLTLAVADVEGNQFHYAHVGDTRLYLLRDHSLVKVSHDHSFVGFLEDSGRLSEEEAMRHPKRNEINKALGFDPQIQSYTDYIETGNSPFLPGDMLLLCSDGLTDMVNAADITSILTQNSTLEEKGAALIIAANEAGGKDNITVVLVQNNKKPVKQKAAKPARGKKIKENNLPAALLSEEAVEINEEKPKRNSRTAIVILSALCVLLLAGFLWQLLKGNEQPITTTPKTFNPEHNEQELKLQSFFDTVRSTKVKLNDSLLGKTIVLTDTIIIDNDSLHLDGSGITLRADQDYHGAALLVSSKTRSFSLQNIILENFDIGMLLQSKEVYFMNVQFRNCRVSMQYQQSLPGKNYLGGALLSDTSFHLDD